ncbi:polygalacturonase-like isoform X2 [Wolffia australiana]
MGRAFLFLFYFFLAALSLVIMVATEEEDIALWEGQMENWTEEEARQEENEILGRIHVNVKNHGAVGDGIADDTQAFLSAWNTSCGQKHSVFFVPKGNTYLVRAARFKGPCADDFTVQISGIIKAPEEPGDWYTSSPRNWLVFSKLKGVRFHGRGVIDGSGSKWWAASCKINKTNPCRGAPTAMTIESSSGIIVRRLQFKNSQQIHLTVFKSDAVILSHLQIEAPFNSPNTDGIHLSESSNIVVKSCVIETGDDCISIVNGCSNIEMNDIHCGPGHGISIGSLGKSNSEVAVSTIVLDKAVLRGTTNGVRIKTWQGGSGYARAITFQNVKMIDVHNPIIIDQFYCDSSTPCQNQ